MKIINSFILLFFVIFVNVNAYGKISSDTLIVNAPSVIFYYPNKVEIDSLGKKSNSGISEIMSDHLYYTNKIGDYLKHNKLKSFYSDSQIFIISNKDKIIQTINRKNLSHIVGTILVNKKGSIEIHSGVSTNITLKNMINKFFKFHEK